MASRGLESYPRPGVTVDLALLTVVGASDTNPELRLLVQDRADPRGRALPGGFIRERWTVARTAEDVLRRKVGIEPRDDIRPRLLRLFDDPDRDDRTWAISAGHSVSLHESDLATAAGDLVPVTRAGTLLDEGPLLFDHDEIVAAAVESLRERYEIRFRYVDIHPDPDGFLPEPFTLHQLRKVHEAVVGDELHKDNFNRRMKPMLEPVLRDGEPVLATNLRGRPAALYRRAR
ncbi:8-oxo-dGTP diphosphatase [Nocardioides sp. J9]|uniref:NrtR DNA-binding winged helix domain-containing protein n=1 Tax=Nocardioides sp. J9 TaxID=935844 RepID=UPI0011A949A7|nr:NUDIX hydrolase [Nocardioides sp. J9]TWH04159.1 8-oxo-dGTP diphosphatase [Nocardioides sp. J9]